MLFAELHGKLGRDSSRAHDRAEDLLTSTVFQLLQYVTPAAAGLFAALGRARRVRWEGEQVFVSTAAEKPPWLPCDTIDGYKLEFWPHWRDAGQPDVVVTLTRNGESVAWLVVEVKLDSPKTPRDAPPDSDVTGEPDRRGDQLFDYFDYLRRQYGSRGVGLIYLTPHPTPPLEELRESLTCCPAAGEGEWLCWLSWRDVWAAAVEAGKSFPPAADLAAILAAKGFKAYTGFRPGTWTAPPQPWRLFRPRAPRPWFSTIPAWHAPSGAPRFWTERRAVS